MEHYEVMGLSKTATVEEIKKAYRRLAMQYHPDRNPGDTDAAEKFKAIAEAYDVLSDPVKRSEYDSRGFIGGSSSFSYEQRTSKQSYTERDDAFVHSASRRYKGTKEELASIQCQFFGGTDVQGKNVLIHVMVVPGELITGCVKAVRWKKRDKCKTCDGYGTASLNRSEFIRCKPCNGTGNVMKMAGKAGSSYPKCDYCDGSGFLDMICRDCKGTGLTPDMIVEEMMIEIPAGTPSGNQIVVRGRGEPGAKGGIAGNLHVIILESASSQKIE
jgi:molecular chaperone DnaJ